MKKPSAKWGHGIASRCPPCGEQCRPLTAHVMELAARQGSSRTRGPLSHSLPPAYPAAPL